MVRKLIQVTAVVALFLLSSCAGPVAQQKETHAAWTKTSSIYEVNIRQYTPEGTFAAFEKHLPRLQKMGVDILWLMPINPIGEKNRKGTLGSYYAVQDYQKVNPEFGTIDDLKHLVNQAHELGMHVIVDWVANHTAWDNWLIQDHPNWYTHDSLGNIIAPVADWTDVADLNYDNDSLRNYMIESMEYWVKEANIDGYRCDVAGMVPTEFWIDVRHKLDSIKPVFMLAEWESKEIHQAFDMTYGWEFHHIMNQIAQGKQKVSSLDSYFAKIDTTYDRDDYIMNFTSNHDENSWNGSEYERMGDAAQVMAVLAATVPGMPLIYTGQEDKLTKRLLFFDKDTVNWGTFPLADFYSKLLHLKIENSALWNGKAGGILQRVQTDNDSVVYAFDRNNNVDKVFVILNLSGQNRSIKLNGKGLNGSYLSLFNQTATTLSDTSTFELEPWGYKVYARQK